MRINLYLPDDKKELYEKAKRILERDNSSISRFLLQELERLVESTQTAEKLAEDILERAGFKKIDVLEVSLPKGKITLDVVSNGRKKFLVDIMKLNDKRRVVIPYYLDEAEGKGIDGLVVFFEEGGEIKRINVIRPDFSSSAFSPEEAVRGLKSL